MWWKKRGGTEPSVFQEVFSEWILGDCSLGCFTKRILGSTWQWEGGWVAPALPQGDLGFGGGDVWASPLPFSEAASAAGAWHFPVCAASSVQEGRFVPLGGNPPQFLVPIGQPQLLSCLRGAPRARLGSAGANLLRCGSPAPPTRRTGCCGRRSISIETRRDMYGE